MKRVHWLYQPKSWVNLDALWSFNVVLVVGLSLVPLLDRSPERDPWRRLLWIGLSPVVLVAWVVFATWGWRTAVVSQWGASPESPTV